MTWHSVRNTSEQSASRNDSPARWSDVVMVKKTTRQARDLGSDWQTVLEQNSTLQLYPPGVTLLQQGAVVQELCVLQHGLVKLAHTAINGRECLFGLRGAGNWPGETAAILREEICYSVVTLTECSLYRLPVSMYLNWLRTDPDFARMRQTAQSRELTVQMQYCADLICLSARQRLEQFLWQLVQASGVSTGEQQSVRLQLPLQQQELASLLAVTPAHLSRLFNELEKDQLLRRYKGWLVMSALDRLWHAPVTAETSVLLRRTE